MDQLIEIRSYVNSQKATFEMLNKVTSSHFNDGIIQGMNLVLLYLNARIEDLGHSMAKEMNNG